MTAVISFRIVDAMFEEYPYINPKNSCIQHIHHAMIAISYSTNNTAKSVTYDKQQNRCGNVTAQSQRHFPAVFQSLVCCNTEIEIAEVHCRLLKTTKSHSQSQTHKLEPGLIISHRILFGHFASKSFSFVILQIKLHFTEPILCFTVQCFQHARRHFNENRVNLELLVLDLSGQIRTGSAINKHNNDHTCTSRF